MYTNTDLLNIIKKRSFLPITQNTFTDSNLLEMATEEMRSVIIPKILSAREDWYVWSELHTITDNLSVDIPWRASGGALREVSIIEGETERNLVRKDLEDRGYTSTQGSANGFIVEGNKIKLLGNTQGQLKLYYYLRVGTLVDDSEAAQITSIDTINNTITCSGGIPDTWATGDTFDLLDNKPNFSYRQISNISTDITGNVITFTDTLPSDIAVGNWVALEEQSPVPQIPVDWFPLLAQATVVQVLQSLGDFEAATRAEARQTKLEKHAMDLLSPRIVGESKKVVPEKNAGSYIGNSWYRR